MSDIKLGSGKRFDQGKLRFDLVNPEAHEGMVGVLTMGADKYGDRNWEKGMAWSKCLASLKRHLSAFERGEDYDPESGKLHVDHIQCNAHFLSAYYRIFPQGDDRYKVALPHPKIGLDIDEVLCDWIGAWVEHFKMDGPKSWFFDKDIIKRFDQLKQEGMLDAFYLGLKPKISPDEIPFEPHCYVTSRPVDTHVTQEWLETHGFPMRPVYTVAVGQSKVEVIRNAGVEIFVDDRYENFEELNRHGLCCFLMDAPHNQRYNVGFKRIKSLKEIAL
jgi:5'(3')-deoxyribonucleotidase